MVSLPKAISWFLGVLGEEKILFLCKEIISTIFYIVSSLIKLSYQYIILNHRQYIPGLP